MLSLMKSRLSADKAGYAGKKLFAILFALLFTASLVNAQDTGELKNKLQMMCDEYSKQMVSGDMAGLWDYYSNDIISLPSYEPMVRGLDAAKASYEKMKASGMKMTKFALTVTDAMQSGDFVVEIGTYKLTMEGGGMDMPWDDYGKYMNLWEVQGDGSMKLKVETWNSDVNPWEEMQKMQAPGEGHEGHQH
jgi:ketosteroid isomerase-like protein